MSDGLKRFRATVRHEGENICDLPWLEEFWAVRHEEVVARIEELEAERDALKSARVKVKPLVWRKGEAASFIHAGQVNGIHYTIMPTIDGQFRVYGVPGPHDNAAQFPTLDAAKAAAQADYEARILAALDPDALTEISGGGDT